MEKEDKYPHFDFNIKKIHDHWRNELGNYEAAKDYLSLFNIKR